MALNTPALGSTIGGKYRLLRLLGQGGMGAVYEAENALTQKRVAIKWMHADVAHDPDQATRLMREAQAAARVHHPNVVDVYDVGQDRDSLFLVMEYLEGEPLTALLQRGGLPLPKVLALLLPAMRGVAAAHRAGVIHRDIKPDNIFLARETDTLHPVPKVLDFGISKLEPRGAEQLALTKTGSTMGTPMYMSYEQLTGAKDIDARADVYAFGVILYEAVTGKPPFEAQSFPELAIKVATRDPTPPKALRPDLPTPLEKLVQWAMAKDREARIASMEALIMELEPFTTEQGFRAHMTLASATLPQLMTTPAGPITERLDSMGRFSTPMSGTIPTAARNARRARWLIAATAVATLLALGAAIAALTHPRTSTSIATPGSKPVSPTRAPASSPPRTPQVPHEAPTPHEAPLAPAPAATENSKDTVVAERRSSTRAQRKARVATAPPASNAPSLAEDKAVQDSAKLAPHEDPKAVDAESESHFRAGKPQRGQF